jgi:hypothetical protein
MKQKSHSPELISRPLVTTASQENDAAKIQKIIMEEYVYMGRQLEAVESPFSQIALSLARFLDTGEYVDTTGVAKVNFSPEPPRRQHPTSNF